ncbi:MAG: flagellar protein FlaG [Burkholderiales bacterium]
MLTNAIHPSYPAAASPVKPDNVANVAPASPVADDKLSMHEAISIANKAMRSLSNGLEFSLDAESGKMVVRVVDSETQQVIRQIPSEEMLVIARALDHMQGLLVNRNA